MQNPSSMEFSEERYSPDSVSLGAFELSPGLIRKLSGFKDLSVSTETLPADLASRAQQSGKFLYFGGDPQTPTVGDMRVWFTHIVPQPVSVVSKQQGNTFSTYTTKGGDSLELLEMGSASAEEMFSRAHTRNTMLTWGLRFAGWLVMLIGFSLFFNFLSVVGSVIPFLGRLIGSGIGILLLLFFDQSDNFCFVLAGSCRKRPLFVWYFRINNIFETPQEGFKVGAAPTFSPDLQKGGTMALSSLF